MRKRDFIILLVLAIVTPLLFDLFVFGNSIPSNISNESWAGFLGSYICNRAKRLRKKCAKIVDKFWRTMGYHSLMIAEENSIEYNIDQHKKPPNLSAV